MIHKFFQSARAAIQRLSAAEVKAIGEVTGVVTGVATVGVAADMYLEQNQGPHYYSINQSVGFAYFSKKDPYYQLKSDCFEGSSCREDYDECIKRAQPGK